jgi:hypothetical protein
VSPSTLSTSLTCRRAGEFDIFTSDDSEGTTEFREVLFRLGGRGGVKPLATGSTGYSSRFHPRNSLILFIALLSIEGMNSMVYAIFHASFEIFRLVFVNFQLVVSQFKRLANAEQEEEEQS